MKIDEISCRSLIFHDFPGFQDLHTNLDKLELFKSIEQSLKGREIVTCD